MNLRKAAEMALDALETWAAMNPNTTACAVRNPAIQALRQALAQPEQEPIAWAQQDGTVYHGTSALIRTDILIPLYTQQEIDDALKRKFYRQPRYTAPPKREWVGLTEVEIYELMEFDDEFEFARAIEAKLKEKNNG